MNLGNKYSQDSFYTKLYLLILIIILKLFMMRNKLLLILVAISLYSVQSYAQILKATITSDAGDIVISLKPEGGDITTDFSQMEFFLRSTDLTTAFTTNVAVNTTNFPGVPINLTGPANTNGGFRTWWFASPSQNSGATNTYTDGVEYELARISFTGGGPQTAVFELVSNLTDFSSYLSILSGGGANLDAFSCIYTSCGAESFFYGDAPFGAGSTFSTESSVAPVPLPIELGSFTGWAETKTNELKWNTQSEENSATFEVERSIDSENFERVGVVSAAGNSAEAITYSFTDENPVTGINYYRLKMVDLDETYEYSEIIQIKRTGQSTIKVFPNPFSKDISIQLTALESGLTQFMVFDITGKQVMAQELEIQSGVSNIDLKLSSLIKGTYVVKVLLPGSEFLTTKIVKKN
jgi:hypothetical protein